MYGWLTRERGNGPRPRAAIPIKFLQLFVWWWAGDGVVRPPKKRNHESKTKGLEDGGEVMG